MNKFKYFTYPYLFLLLISCGSGEESQSELTKKSNTESTVFEKSETTFSDNGNDVNVNLMSEDISIKLTPFVPNYDGVGESGCRLLKDRLNNAITKVGFGGEGSNPRFIIGPSVNMLTSDLTATAPAKYACTYEVNFMVVDVQTETVLIPTHLSLRVLVTRKKKHLLVVPEI